MEPEYAHLPELWAGEAREGVDANGHVGVVGCVQLHVEAGWVLMDVLGVDEQYRSAVGASLFDIEHHLRYRAELREGARVSVRYRLLGRSERALHGVTHLVDVGADRVVNSMEFITLHVALASRRTVPFPEPLAGRLDEAIGSHLGSSDAWSPALTLQR